MALDKVSVQKDDKPSPTNPKPGPKTFLLPLDVTFYLFFISNLIAASVGPIQDCDEVFNYWEPVHYLQHGHGFETWEYSPEYSIRSWLYVALHSLVGKAASLFTSDKVYQFYAIRCALGFACTACEVRLYSAISRFLNPQIGVLFVMVMVFNAGMFHAGVAMLPSSFAMLCAMLGMASFMDWKRKDQISRGIMWFGVGAIVGWPFAGALVLPFVLEELVIAFLSPSMKPTILRIVEGGVRCLLVLAFEVAVDSLFYRKITVVPWNIVAYNVFGGEERGPEIYGIEPWHFYIKNLLLNFNLWFVLAFISGPLLVFQGLVRPQATSKQTLFRSMTLVSPFYMWLGIFTAQAHKEERFMYPLYPFLGLSASISLQIIISYVVSNDSRELIGRIPAKLKVSVVAAALLSATSLGVLRSSLMTTAYNAPLKVLGPLGNETIALPGSQVCLGKEWYRFPSSYHLPNTMRAKFIQSEHRGLLPGEFAEDTSLFSAAAAIPPGMNDLNIADPSKYVDVSQCQFLVDSTFPGREPAPLEPDYASDEATWEKVVCLPFLDTARTGLLGRIIWTPDLPIIPARFRRHWGEYCLLRRTNNL